MTESETHQDLTLTDMQAQWCTRCSKKKKACFCHWVTNWSKVLALFAANYEEFIHSASYLCAHGLHTGMDMWVCVSVSAQLQFHTELSTVSVSAEISVCLWLDLQMSHSLCHIMLKGKTLCGSKVLVWRYFTFCCPHQSPTSPSLCLCAPLSSCTDQSWTVLLKMSEWLSEGLVSCCMLMSSALH